MRPPRTEKRLCRRCRQLGLPLHSCWALLQQRRRCVCCAMQCVAIGRCCRCIRLPLRAAPQTGHHVPTRLLTNQRGRRQRRGWTERPLCRPAACMDSNFAQSLSSAWASKTASRRPARRFTALRAPPGRGRALSRHCRSGQQCQGAAASPGRPAGRTLLTGGDEARAHRARARGLARFLCGSVGKTQGSLLACDSCLCWLQRTTLLQQGRGSSQAAWRLLCQKQGMMHRLAGTAHQVRCAPHCAIPISQNLHAAPQLRPEAQRYCLHKVSLICRGLATCLGCSGSAMLARVLV